MKRENNKQIYRKKDYFGFKFDLNFRNGKAELSKELFPDELTSNKAYKEYKKLTSKIKFKDTEFQADPVSINFMSAVLNLANLRYNQAIVLKEMPPKEAYEAIYGQTIMWKDVKNNWVTIRIDELGEGLELALEKLKEILEKY